MQDHSEGSSLQNQALQTLQERLHEADASLKREQESYKQMQVRMGTAGFFYHLNEEEWHFTLIKLNSVFQKMLFLWQKLNVWTFSLIFAKFI